MNWEAINAISQFISSIAVVLSVLYLGIQVHRSTRSQGGRPGRRGFGGAGCD